MDLERFLELDDSFQINLWIKVAEKVIEMKRRDNQNLAIQIANGVGKVMAGKR